MSHHSSNRKLESSNPQERTKEDTKMSSVNRRLRAIFTKSVPAKTKVKPKFNVAAKSSDISAFPEETKLLKLVNEFKKSCEDPKFRCKISIYRRTVRRLANAKKFSMIEDALESQKKYESIRVEGFANRLISLYGESGMFEHAHKLFDEMPELNCERTVKSFNVLLKAALDAKKFDKVVEIFKEFPPIVSVEPDLFSYNIVIHSFCEMGSFDDALSVFHEMEGNGMEPSLITYNTLLNALYRNGKFLEAERLWTMMERENIAPDVRTYNARLRGIFIGDAGLEADEVISEMERKGIKPDLVSYNALIKGFCDGGNLKEAMKWYGELQKNNCRSDLVTFATLIPACCSAGDLVVAYELCLKAIDRRVLLKAAVFKNVVDGLVRKVKYDEASELVKLVNSASHLNYKLE